MPRKIFSKIKWVLAAAMMLMPGTWPARAAETGPGIEFALVNPGYTVDGVKDVGEVIVLRKRAEGTLRLEGAEVVYVTEGGSSYSLVKFPAGEMVGEEIQLRLKNKGVGDFEYSKTIAVSGMLKLMWQGQVMDSVCWGLGGSCATKFNSDAGKRTVLERGADGSWAHVAEYAVGYDAARPGFVAEEGRGEMEAASACRGLEFSEILSFYETDKSEQFIEFYNGTSEQMVLTGCAVKYKNKSYALSGVVGPEGYLVYKPEFVMTKNPTSSNLLELVDADGQVIDSLTYYNGQKKGVALAQFGHNATGAEQWLQTYLPTPGSENDYQKYKTCPAGKVINEETGNCVKDTTLDTTLEACPEGKYRNPLTGRCKSYASESEPKECAEGYERNPETGRCRKIRDNTGAEWGVREESEEGDKSFTMLAVVAVMGALGAGYVAWQFRKEIAKGAKWLMRKLRR